MTFEGTNPNPITDWTGDSVAFFPTFFDEPYNLDDIDINSYQWLELDAEIINTAATTTASTTTTAASDAPMHTTQLTNPSSPILSESSKKRKASDDGSDLNPKEKDGKAGARRVNKKGLNKSAGNSDREGRWAEQLLNPCATAITTGNMSRVQHLMYVLHELASPTGDPNHRLAFHGLRAIAHHLSSPSTSMATFASSEPRFFRKSLLKFNEISPWFAFPNNVTNSSILQILEPENPKTLHIVDIGVSHGAQWPTLLDGLSRRSGGPPPLVRLTIVAPTENEVSAPFHVGPPSYDFSPQLLEFAKSININLRIDRIDDLPLLEINSQSIKASSEETLIVSTQFRLHHLNHGAPDERTLFLNALRGLEPKGVVLTENNENCSCTNCVDFGTGFSSRVEYLWRFLDSTSSAFRGGDTNERRLMEGEAAKFLTDRAAMNEGKARWFKRMMEAGFVGEAFCEDAVDGARALLRKHDNNWEMKVEEKVDGCLSLWWKGQPVSFSSLWRVDDQC